MFWWWTWQTLTFIQCNVDEIWHKYCGNKIIHTYKVSSCFSLRLWIQMFTGVHKRHNALCCFVFFSFYYNFPCFSGFLKCPSSTSGRWCKRLEMLPQVFFFISWSIKPHNCSVQINWCHSLLIRIHSRTSDGFLTSCRLWGLQCLWRPEWGVGGRVTQSSTEISLMIWVVVVFCGDQAELCQVTGQLIQWCIQ